MRTRAFSPAATSNRSTAVRGIRGGLHVAVGHHRRGLGADHQGAVAGQGARHHEGALSPRPETLTPQEPQNLLGGGARPHTGQELLLPGAPSRPLGAAGGDDDPPAVPEHRRRREGQVGQRARGLVEVGVLGGPHPGQHHVEGLGADGDPGHRGEALGERGQHRSRLPGRRAHQASVSVQGHVQHEAKTGPAGNGLEGGVNRVVLQTPEPGSDMLQERDPVEHPDRLRPRAPDGHRLPPPRKTRVLVGLDDPGGDDQVALHDPSMEADGNRNGKGHFDFGGSRGRGCQDPGTPPTPRPGPPRPGAAARPGRAWPPAPRGWCDGACPGPPGR